MRRWLSHAGVGKPGPGRGQQASGVGLVGQDRSEHGLLHSEMLLFVASTVGICSVKSNTPHKHGLKPCDIRLCAFLLCLLCMLISRRLVNVNSRPCPCRLDVFKAPEFLKSQPPNDSSDSYSAGMCIFYMLSGKQLHNLGSAHSDVKHYMNLVGHGAL